MKVALLFSGQGAQYVGMGKDLYENFELAEDYFDYAEDVLKTSIKKICFEGSGEELKKTENTQPAVLLMSFICCKLLVEEGYTFDTFAGFSLGEYSALAANGVISLDDALRIVRERGLIIEKAVPSGKGGMAAILGLEDKQVEDVCKEVDGIVVPANYNSPGQLVISGDMKAVEKACGLAERAGAKMTVILNVSGPFHSPLLQDASIELKNVLDRVEFNSLKDKKVISNVTADYHNDQKIKDMLVKQMYSPVKWRDSIERLINDGYDTFVEVGPGKTLTGFMRSINREKNAINVGDVESLKKALEILK